VLGGAACAGYALAARPASAAAILVFPGAPHGFHADYRESYRELAAREAWRRTLAWFAENGGALAPAGAGSLPG